jgi:hypothetical protein
LNSFSNPKASGKRGTVSHCVGRESGKKRNVGNLVVNKREDQAVLRLGLEGYGALAGGMFFGIWDP